MAGRLEDAPDFMEVVEEGSPVTLSAQMLEHFISMDFLESIRLQRPRNFVKVMDYRG